MNRLENMFPEVAFKLRHAPAAKQRAACWLACDLAVRKANLNSSEVRECLDLIRDCQPATEAQIRQVEKLRNRLEKRYFELAEAEEQGRGDVEDSIVPFSGARALSAVLAALLSDGYEADSEAIYEATAAFDNSSELLSAVNVILTKKNSLDEE